jgi:glucan phosphoethanolaminetransferase (alkaline phosphatase superfamily)
LRATVFSAIFDIDYNPVLNASNRPTDQSQRTCSAETNMQIILNIHALIALVMMMIYSSLIALSLNALILHPLVILSIYIVLFITSPKKYLVLITSMTSFLLLLLYLSNFVAARYWHDSISASFLISNKEVILNELTRFPIYLALLPVVVFVLLYKTYKKILPQNKNSKKELGLLPAVPIIVMIFYMVCMHISLEVSAIWQGEPVYEFLQPDPESSGTLQAIIVPESASGSGSGQARKPNIILIHADALRADRLGLYGNPRETTPFIDSLAVDAKPDYPFSMSNCNESICGFSSVLASDFSYAAPRVNLLEVLGKAGYFLNFIGAGDLDHAGLGRFFEPRLDNFLRADRHDGYYRHDDLFILDTLKKFPEAPDASSFFYLRMMSSHGLGSHPQKYQKFQPVTGSLFEVFSGGASKEMRINDHDNFALQLDAYVKEIFETLRNKGYLDNAIVVLFGDHGDAIGEHDTYGHYQTLYQAEIHVPIIFWSSSNIDLELEKNQIATLADIPATILHHLNLPVPESFRGQALQNRPIRKKSFLNSPRGARGLLYDSPDGVFKLIVDAANDKHQLFDLNQDPGEQNNLLKDKPDLYETMKAYLD